MVTLAQPSRRFLSPGDKLGKHEVIRQIAVGGMAELYLTRTVGIEGFEKLACIKRILPQYINTPSFVNMFLNEARLAATLHHANIAQVYDIGQESGEYFFSMEYVHGEDLGRLVTTGRENGVPISLDCALTVAAGLCAGLHYAHEKAAPDGKPLGVVHRDVSPTNVLVSYDGAVKLVDFGIARAGEPSASPSHNGLKGKIAYMSPEQCRGRTTLDRRSDVFSIGTMLYELTTGRLPFVDETEYGVLHQIVNRDADPPSHLVPNYPPALEAILMRALARDPDRRLSTALELQHQLEDFAHENRLRVSPLVLARLMSTLFPARLEEWDHARAQGGLFLEQHIVRTLIESGKTADGATGSPRSPSSSDVTEGSMTGAATPATELTSPALDPAERTQLGPEPRLRPSLPGMTSEPPGARSLQPIPQPAMASGPPAAGGRSQPSRPMPVPSMPGAVSNGMPSSIPLFPSGGTLVSSATQAGSQPPAVKPLAGPYGSPGGLDGFAGQSAHGGPGGFAGQNGYGAPGGQVGQSGYVGQGGFAGQSGQAGFGGVPVQDAAPIGNGSNDVTDRVRVPVALPTLRIRIAKRSRLPIVALGLVVVAGASASIWMVLDRSSTSTAPAATVRSTVQPSGTAPVAATPDLSKPAKPAAEPAKASAEPAVESAKGSAEPAAPAGEPAGKAAEPAGKAAEAPGKAAEAPGKAAEAPAAKVAKPSTPTSGAKPVPEKGKPAGGVLQEPPTKTIKPKKRAKRAPKAEPKEQPWNDDSPFMPVTTPKH